MGVIVKFLDKSALAARHRGEGWYWWVLSEPGVKTGPFSTEADANYDVFQRSLERDYADEE